MSDSAFNALRKGVKTADTTEVIGKFCRDKTVLDLGFINHAAEKADNPGWLHGEIKSVAGRVVGVDYLARDVEILRARGLEVICADVTEPMCIEETFDVITAFHLIEHLTNLDGFFRNCQTLLKQEGIIVISTPNPFYIEAIHFLALKNRVLVNPEHTCWIDPQCLAQLGLRYGFEISDLFFINKSWRLRWFITENESNRYDILLEKWIDDSAIKKAIRFFSGLAFHVLYTPVRILSLGYCRWLRHGEYIAILRRATERT